MVSKIDGDANKMYTPQRRGPQSLRALAREKGKVVTYPPLPTQAEEDKVEPPPMTPEEAIHAKALEVISGGGGEGMPPDGDISRHIQFEGSLDVPSLEQKDWAALQARISGLESELYDYQFNMGLLLLQRKDWGKQMDEQKSAVTKAQDMLQQEKAAHSLELTEAQKHEEAAKRALNTEQQCVADLEKVLKEMQAEGFEVKEAADRQLSQAKEMLASVEEKSAQADTQLAKVQGERTQTNRKLAESQLQLREVEMREDALRREHHRLMSEIEAQKAQMVQEESTLREWERELIGKQEQLHEEEQKLNEREELINNRFETLKQSEKGLEVTCAMLERDQAVLEQSEAELISRTVVVTDREEVLKEKDVAIKIREQELLVVEERLAGRQRVFNQHEEHVKDTEAYVAREREWLDAFDMGVKMREEAVAEHKQELVKVVEVEERELSLDLRLQKVENLEKAVWVEGNKYKAEHQKIVPLNEEISRDRSDLEIVQKELHIENQQVKAEYEHLRKEKELDRQQIEDAWAKVRKDWELEKGKMEEERKKVEDEISGKWQQLELHKEMLHKEFQQKIRELENETSAERERLKKEVYLERRKLQDENEVDREKAVQERDKAWMEIAEERQQIAQHQEDLKVQELEQQELANVQLQLKQELDEIQAHKCFVDEEAKELQMQKEKFEQGWELLDEMKKTVKKDAEKFGEESKCRSKWLERSEEQLRISKLEIEEQSLKMAEELKRERDAWKTKMESERTQLYAQLDAEHQVLVHNLEMQRAEFERLVSWEEVIEKQMEECEAHLQSEIEKENEELKRSKRSLLMEMEQLELEHQKLEGEWQDLGKQREEADKERIEICKDIENLDLQLQKLKEQHQNLHQEREEVLHEAEKLHKLRTDLTEAENSLHTAEPAIHHQTMLEARSPQQQEVNPIPIQEMTPSVPEHATSISRSPGKIAWLWSCASHAAQLFSQPSAVTGMVADIPDTRKGGTLTESSEHGDTPKLKHSPRLNQSQLAQVVVTEKQMQPYKRTQSIRAVVEDAIRMLGSETPHRVSNSKQKSAAGDLDTPPTGKKRSHEVAAKEQDEDETKSEVGGEKPHKRRLHDILLVSTGVPNGVSLHGDMHSLPIVSPGSQRYDFQSTTIANILLSPTTSRDVEGTDFHQDVNAERTVLSTGPDRARKSNLPATASSALSNVPGAKDVLLNESSKLPEGHVAVTQDGKGLEVEVAKITDENKKEVDKKEDGEEDREEDEDGEENDLDDDATQEMGVVAADKETEEQEDGEDDVYDDEWQAHEDAKDAEKDKEDEKPMTLGEKFWNFLLT
ncbi:hypothetical protein BDL97_20G004100 [Sphagnum fallax]|nr:hypothetical protein BDL97_20G004100 [Sphagnum fallax]